MHFLHEAEEGPRALLKFRVTGLSAYDLSKIISNSASPWFKHLGWMLVFPSTEENRRFCVLQQGKSINTHKITVEKYGSTNTLTVFLVTGNNLDFF